MEPVVRGVDESADFGAPPRCRFVRIGGDGRFPVGTAFRAVDPGGTAIQRRFGYRRLGSHRRHIRGAVFTSLGAFLNDFYVRQREDRLAEREAEEQRHQWAREDRTRREDKDEADKLRVREQRALL